MLIEEYVRGLIRSISMVTDEDATKEIVSEKSKPSQQQLNLEWALLEHKTHYQKWVIRNGLSIRLHLIFDDKPELIGKFILKNHDEKKDIVINRQFALSLINGSDMVDEPMEVRGFIKNKKYKKQVFVNDAWEYRDDEELDNADSERLWKKIERQHYDIFIRRIGSWEYKISYIQGSYILVIEDDTNTSKTHLFTTYDELVKKIKSSVNIKSSKLFLPSDEKIKELENVKTV